MTEPTHGQCEGLTRKDEEMAKTIWVFDGKGRCAGSRAYVLGATLEAARARLLRDDSCPFFDIAEAVPFIAMPREEGR